MRPVETTEALPAPTLEQIFGYYSQASQLALTDFEQMFNKTICRPAGYATFMLEENHLAEPKITLVRGESPEACFTILDKGEVGVVAIASDTADGVINQLGLTDKVQFNDAVSQVVTMSSADMELKETSSALTTTRLSSRSRLSGKLNPPEIRSPVPATVVPNNR